MTPEHLAARREQILEAALRCFLANGFHATSMQDILRESRLSTGAVYRYFPSKNAIVTAIAERIMSQVVAELTPLTTREPSPSLRTVVAEALAIVEPRLDREMRMAVTVWGEAMRDPELAELIRGFYRQIRDKFVAIARRAQEQGELPPDADPAAVGPAITGFVQGYILQRILVGDISREQYLQGLRHLIGAGPA